MMLMEMDAKSFSIVRYRFHHPQTPLSVIARRYRISTQAVHQRLQQLATKWPGVRDLVGLKLKRK